MKTIISIKKIAIFSVIAAISVGLGIYNVCWTNDYTTISAVFQAALAAVAFTSISEIAAMLSKFPVLVYTLTSIGCAILAHIATPWYVIMPRVDLNVGNISNIYQAAIMSSLTSYLAALIIALLAGIFILHRKELFKTHQS
ncbi:MAG: hypothetical protein ACI4JZ_09675 [Oscillospiraceae bacterium]